MCVCACAYMCRHLCVYACVCTCMYVCMYMCICMWALSANECINQVSYVHHHSYIVVFAVML